MQASRDLSLRVFHRLGSNQLIVSLQIAEGEDAYSRVLQTFRQARLPSCFLRPTLEYVALAIREALADDDLREVGAFEVSALSEVEAKVANPRTLQLKGFIPADECPWGFQFASGAKSSSRTFWCAYDFLLRHRPSFFRTIGTLENSYLQEIRELFMGRATAVCQLQQCQVMEMEGFRRQVEAEDASAEDGRLVLVGQHVSEIEALEHHWQSEIEELKAKQEASYRDLVVDFFEQEMIKEKETGRQLAEPEADYLACPLHPEAWKERVRKFSDSFETSAELEAELEASKSLGVSSLSKISEVRTTFGPKAFFILRLWVGDIMELACGEPSASSAASVADEDDGAGPQLPRDFLGLESYRCDSYISS